MKVTLDPGRKFFVHPGNAAVSQGVLDRRKRPVKADTINLVSGICRFFCRQLPRSFRSSGVASPRLDPDESSDS